MKKTELILFAFLALNCFGQEWNDFSIDKNLTISLPDNFQVSDTELRIWIETLDNNRLTQFFNYLSNEFVAYPISKYSQYLDLYYPTSWEILRKCK